MAPVEQRVVQILAGIREPVPSVVIETKAELAGLKPAAVRQALRRLAARGHIHRLANGGRGRYVVADTLFRQFLMRRGRGD